MENKKGKKLANIETKFADAARELIGNQPPGGWTSWLFDIQNSLIQYNHLEGFTLKGSGEFASSFSSLKQFFDEVSKLEHQNK